MIPDAIPAIITPEVFDRVQKRCEPVSYTHLDVYKRQAISRGELQINIDPRISEWGNPHGVMSV